MASPSNFNDILTKLHNTNRTSHEDKELSNMMNGVDFANDETNLKNLNFSKLTLTNVTFNGATIMNCNFDYSTLVNCSFDGAHIGASSRDREETTFSWAILEGTNFKNTQIWNTSFCGAYLKDATFKQSVMSGVSFVDSILLNAIFDNSLFELSAGETDFDGAVTIQTSFDAIEHDEDDDVDPIFNLKYNHNPSKHIVVIKGLDKAKISDYFLKIRQIRDEHKLRPLHKLVLDRLKGAELAQAKEMFPHLFTGQIDKKTGQIDKKQTFLDTGGKRKTRKYRKSKKSKKHKRHTKNRK
jgi:hypothetical protein